MGADYRRNTEEKIKDVINSVLQLKVNSTEPTLLEGQEKLRRTLSFPECSQILKDYFYLEIVPDEKKPTQATVRAFDALRPLLHDYIVNKEGLNNHIDTFSYKPNSEPGRPHPDIKLLEKIARSGRSWSIEKEKSRYEIRPLKTFFELAEFENAVGTFCFFKPQENLTQLYLYAAHQHTQLFGIWKNEEPLGLIPLMLMKRKDDFPILYLEAPMSLINPCDLHPEDKSVLIEGILDILPEYAALLKMDPYYCIGDGRKTGSQYDPLIKSLVETAAARFNSKIKITSKKKYPEPNGRRDLTLANHDGSVGLELLKDTRLLSYLSQHGYPFSSICMFWQAFLQDENWQNRRLWKEWGEMKGKSRILPDVTFHQYFVHHLEEYHDTARPSQSNSVCG